MKSFKRMSRPAIAAAAFLCLGTIGSSGRDSDAPQMLPSGLERTPSTAVRLAYLRPGANLRNFKSVHIQTLVVPTTVRDTAPGGERPRLGESYLLRDRDVADIQRHYDDAFRSVFGRAGIPVVDTPQAGTLIVATEVSDITLNAPLEHTRGTGNRVRVYSEGAGSISIKAVLADGGTGEIIAAVADSRQTNELWQRNTRPRSG